MIWGVKKNFFKKNFFKKIKVSKKKISKKIFQKNFSKKFFSFGKIPSIYIFKVVLKGLNVN